MGKNYLEGFKILAIVVGLGIILFLGGAISVIKDFSKMKAFAVIIILALLLAGIGGVAYELASLHSWRWFWLLYFY